jgi:hypothetical protein
MVLRTDGFGTDAVLRPDQYRAPFSTGRLRAADLRLRSATPSSAWGMQRSLEAEQTVPYKRRECSHDLEFR